MNVLIVESKAKCKTLLKHLGKNEWRVLPTGGHVERLAEDRKLHPPKEVRKAYWSNRPGELPDPPWFWTERGEAALRAIKDEAVKHDAVTFYLATDPDREGERIAWHLQRLLSELGPCHRVSFQEITKSALLDAVASPRRVEQPIVDSALIRTFIDRAVGWRATRIAKRFTTTSSGSMGRVQTPTLGFVVERELEREAHKPVRYFEVAAATELTEWHVRFHEKSDAAAWVDEKNRFVARRTGDESLARSAHAALVTATRIRIDAVDRREKSQPPRPPFSTDTLIQAAGSRWGWSPKKTAVLAGKLYEAGHVTYIRTDSTRLAAEAVQAGRAVIVDAWGADQVGSPSATSAAGAAVATPGVQDAHEAIRPTDLALAAAPDDLDPDARRLYALVRARTLASLMVPSRRVTLSLRASCEGTDRALAGSVGWYADPGWRWAFQATSLDGASDTAPVEVNEGAVVQLSPGDDENPNPELREGQTEPPSRFRPHTLVKVMKDAGIGRPSTYAKTIDRLLERSYVTEEQGALVPTESGRNIWLEAAPLFALSDDREVFQVEYTAAMESLLDDVAEGRREASAVWETMLGEFKDAHLAAQEASKSGALLPRTRHKLTAFLIAAPELTDEVGDLDALSEAEGKELLAKLRERGIALLPSAKQLAFVEKLLEATGMTIEQAVEGAGLRCAGSEPNRDEISELIDHLSKQAEERRVPSVKQLRLIEKLAGKAGLDEGSACALVGVGTYGELSGGKEGTASALIDALRGDRATSRRARAPRVDV